MYLVSEIIGEKEVLSMKQHIAVQEGLRPVVDYLVESGYKVSEFTTGQKGNKDFLDGFDAIVLTGIDDNIMGIQTTNHNRPLIEARGMTPEDIKRAIEQRAQVDSQPIL